MHAHPKCSQFVHDCLDMIERDMIIVESEGAGGKRARASVLYDRLRRMEQRCAVDVDYATRGVPVQRHFQAAVPVLGELNAAAREAVEKKMPTMLVYRGRTRRTLLSDPAEGR